MSLAQLLSRFHYKCSLRMSAPLLCPPLPGPVPCVSTVLFTRHHLLRLFTHHHQQMAPAGKFSPSNFPLHFNGPLVW